MHTKLFNKYEQMLQSWALKHGVTAEDVLSKRVKLEKIQYIEETYKPKLIGNHTVTMSCEQGVIASCHITESNIQEKSDMSCYYYGATINLVEIEDREFIKYEPSNGG